MFFIVSNMFEEWIHSSIEKRFLTYNLYIIRSLTNIRILLEVSEIKLSSRTHLSIFSYRGSTSFDKILTLISKSAMKKYHRMVASLESSISGFQHDIRNNRNMILIKMWVFCNDLVNQLPDLSIKIKKLLLTRKINQKLLNCQENKSLSKKWVRQHWSKWKCLWFWTVPIINRFSKGGLLSLEAVSFKEQD